LPFRVNATGGGEKGNYTPSPQLGRKKGDILISLKREEKRDIRFQRRGAKMGGKVPRKLLAGEMPGSFRPLP